MTRTAGIREGRSGAVPIGPGKKVGKKTRPSRGVMEGEGKEEKGRGIPDV